MKLKNYMRIQGVINGTVWFLIGWGMGSGIIFGFFDNDGKISAQAAATFMIIASFFAGIFALIGGITSTRKDYLNDKVELEQADSDLLPKMGPPRNPWEVAITQSLIQWPIVAIAAAAACFVIFPDGLSSKMFGLFSAHALGIHAAIMIKRNAGRELIKFIAHPPKAPPPFKKYLLKEHLLGSGAANLIINALFGYIIFHPGPKLPDGIIKADHLVVDIFIMCFIISVLVALGASAQAETDFKAGRTLGPKGNPTSHPNFFLRVMAYIGLAVMAVILSKAAFTVLGLETFSLVSVIVMKGIIAAIIAVLSATLAARWGAVKAANQST